MKKITTTLLSLLIITSAFAQSPDMMTYQAVIRDAGGNLVRNTQIGMRISIVQTAPDGTEVYTEEYSVTTNANGLVSVKIGSGSDDSSTSAGTLKSSEAVSGTNVSGGGFSSIDWTDGPYFIKVETDPAGGTNFTITGTSQLLSVPYAKYAESSGNVKFTDGDNSDDAVYTKGNVGIGTSDPQVPLHIKTNSIPALIISSSTTNDPSRPGIQFSNNTSQFISGDGLSDELFGFYSIWSNTRTYDAKLRIYGKATGSWGTYLEMTHDGTNGTIRTDKGDLNVSPKDDLNLNPEGDLNLNPAGNISAGNKNISDVAQPVNANDVVTKAYIDDLISLLLDLTQTYTSVDFSASKTNLISQKIGNIVYFKDKSSIIGIKPDNDEVRQEYTKWLWDFGDGTTSTLQNPMHTYSKLGTYTVKLTASIGPKSETIERINYIRVLKVQPTVTDYDGNVYPAVWIGDKLWMAENLKVTHYPNGDKIVYSGDFTTCDNYIRDDIGTYFYYNFNNALGEEYGYFYSVDAAKNWSKDNADGQGICPDGWHIPTVDEWNDLKTYLSPTGYRGNYSSYWNKIREKGTSHWDYTDETITNETGFTLLGSGRYEYGGSFRYLKVRAELWLVTGDTGSHLASALPVRCVKD